MKFLVLGSLNIDKVYSLDHFIEPGETLCSDDIATFTGGKGFNQAFALAKAGAKVSFVGAVGADGKWLVDALAKTGIDTEGIRVCDYPTGHAIIEVVPSGQNRILVCPGANAHIDPASFSTALEKCSPGDVLLVQNETSYAAEAIRLAKSHALRVALNPSPFDKRISTLPLEEVDIFLLNEVEGAKIADLPADSAPEKIIAAIASKYPSAKIVLTLGGKGAVSAAPGGKVLATENAFAVTAVDTTAAGDTFTGFYLQSACVAALNSDKEESYFLARACAASAIAVTRKGAAPSIPESAEVDAFLKDHGK